MKYIDYIRALKSGVVICDYNYNPMLERLALMKHVLMRVVLPNTGRGYREYSYKPPVATIQENLTVADAPAPPLAVVSKPLLARIRLADKIRYVDGKRIVSEQWSGQAYKVTGAQGDYMLLEYGNGVIGRLSQNIKIA